MKAKVTDLADFTTTAFGYFEIVTWAKSDEGGGLPDPSARPFAAWLDGCWADFQDEENPPTNEDVLKGAIAFWKGEA